MELSLWQLPAGNMSTLWQMLALLKGYDDFLVDWAFTELPQSPPSIESTAPRRQEKIRTNLPNCFVIVCQGAKDSTSLLEEGSCQNHNVWAASVCRLPLLVDFNRAEKKKKVMASCSDWEKRLTLQHSTIMRVFHQVKRAETRSHSLMFKFTFPVCRESTSFATITSCCIFSLSLSLRPSPPPSCHPRSHLVWHWGVSLSRRGDLHPRGLALWPGARLPRRLRWIWQTL